MRAAWEYSCLDSAVSCSQCAGPQRCVGACGFALWLQLRRVEIPPALFLLHAPGVAFFREWIGNGNGDHPLINPGPWGGENAGPAKTTLACRRRTPCSVDWPRYELLRTHHVGPARANWNAQHEFNAVRSTMYVQVYAQFVPRSLFLPLLNSPFPALPAAMKSSLLLVPTRSPECPSPLKLC